ncbi:MAG: RHS repeat protein, partial [Abitibacteriaceae bacterium]|nr:RHS repeat protein [Abditibacteriaceae bacterium]
NLGLHFSCAACLQTPPANNPKAKGKRGAAQNTPPVGAMCQVTRGDNTAFKPHAVGHFLIVQKLDPRQQTVSLYNPQEQRHYTFTYVDLDHEWSGTGLVLDAKSPSSRMVASRPAAANPQSAIANPQFQKLAWLSEADMAHLTGGCWAALKQGRTGHHKQQHHGPTCPKNGGGTGGGHHGGSAVQTYSVGEGDAGGGGFGGSDANDFGPFNDAGLPGQAVAVDYGGDDGSDDEGSPVWSVDEVSFNLLITDTPLWYTPAVGPPVRISMSYNSQDASSQNTVLGNKWSFNYGSYLLENSGGEVTVYMPDGRQDTYVSDGNGGYNSQMDIFNTLTKTTPTHYEITFQTGDKMIYDIPAGTTSLQPFLVEERDRWGNSLHFGYDANVHLTTITDAQGRVTVLHYDSAGHINLVDDPFGRHCSFGYDTYGNLTSATDMGGNSFGYTYDSEVKVIQLSTPQGNWLFHQEGPDGNLYGADSSYPAPGAIMATRVRLTVTDPLLQKEEFFWGGGDDHTGNYAYIDKNSYIEYTPSHNNGSNDVPKTLWTANALIGGYNGGGGYPGYPGSGGSYPGYSGRVTDITYPSPQHNGYPAPAVEHLDYNSNGLVSTRTRYLWSANGTPGNHASATYNALGRTTSLTDAKGQTTTYNYAPNGIDLTSVVDALGHTTVTYHYNAYHQPDTITDGLNHTTTITYTAWGAVASVTDPDNHTTTYNYDTTTQLLTSITRDSATLGTYTYDTVGRLRTATDAAGYTLTYDYDSLDRVTHVTYPDTTHVDYNYLCCGLLSSVVDRAGRATSY